MSLAVDADGELRQGTELANTSSRVIEVMSVMLAYSITDSYLSDGGIDQSMEISRISMLQAEFNDYANQLRTAGGPSRASPRSGTRPSSPTPPTSRWTSASTPGRSTSTPRWRRSTCPRRRGTSPTRTPSTGPSSSGPTTLDSNAYRQRLLFGGLGLAAVLATVTLTLLVSRSITRPLRSLTRQAKDMAGRRLPTAVLEVLETPLGEDVPVPNITPIGVKTRDEVADVADALNTVQDSALDLAVEQAVLRRNIADSFINLGRRNQNLLSRQLDFITAAGGARGRPRHARRPLPPRPPGHPHAPQRRVAAGARRDRAAPAVGGARCAIVDVIRAALRRGRGPTSG